MNYRSIITCQYVLTISNCYKSYQCLLPNFVFLQSVPVTDSPQSGISWSNIQHLESWPKNTGDFKIQSQTWLPSWSGSLHMLPSTFVGDLLWETQAQEKTLHFFFSLLFQERTSCLSFQFQEVKLILFSASQKSK